MGEINENQRLGNVYKLTDSGFLTAARAAWEDETGKK